MKAQSASPGPRYEALLELLRAAEALWNASRVFFARWDLSPSQFNVLNVLYEQPRGCTQVELSRQLIMHRSNITGLVDRLEARGLVRREDNPADRRAFNVTLTPAGARLIRHVLPWYHDAAEKVWGNMSSKRAQQLASELAEVSASAGRMADKSLISNGRKPA